MIIIEKAFYVNCRGCFFIKVLVKDKNEEKLLAVDVRSYKYYDKCEEYVFYLGEVGVSFYTEDLVKEITKKLQIALFCEQFIPGSKYKTEPDFEIVVDSFKELAEILDKADKMNKTSVRTVVI